MRFPLREDDIPGSIPPRIKIHGILETVMKQTILPLIGVAIFIIVVGLFVKKSSSFSFPEVVSPSPVATSSANSVIINGKVIEVEIVNTQALRTKGLSGRASLESGRGMFFVFDNKNINAVFWMKDTLIPLDIVWIKDKSVIGIVKNAQPPAPNTPDDKLEKYLSPGTIDYVLEVNSGFSDQNNIKVGDSVQMQFDPEQL